MHDATNFYYKPAALVKAECIKSWDDMNAWKFTFELYEYNRRC